MSLTISNVNKRYKVRLSGTEISALNGVTLNLAEGRTLGIVGESGCGKSTLARLVVGLEAPTEGEIQWDGEAIGDKNRSTWRSHSSRTQLVFQDPYSSLNPRQRIGDSIAEVIKVHKLRADNEIEKRVLELLAEVGIAADMRNRYPHQLSGGQRQRVSIARALASEPSLLVLDEPVSALDVSVRAEVMNLLIDLRDKLGLTYIFISHDLSMIRHISDQIAVMYLGKIVEIGTWDSVLENPLHPYTQALIASMPDHSIFGQSRERRVLMGEVPNPADMPSGCAFHMRCPIARPSCSTNAQVLKVHGTEHLVACEVVQG